jgi:NTP pyrophosphatase (non-canonical NTP hydrolase)
MSNMSYCRFHNTLGDLHDCLEALRDLSTGCGESLSESELSAALHLVDLCNEVVEECADEDLEDLNEECKAEEKESV